MHFKQIVFNFLFEFGISCKYVVQTQQYNKRRRFILNFLLNFTFGDKLTFDFELFLDVFKDA